MATLHSLANVAEALSANGYAFELTEGAETCGEGARSDLDVDVANLIAAEQKPSDSRNT